MLSLITSLVPGIFKLGDKLIEDKDLRNEFAFKSQERVFGLMETMLNTKTTPWVDATVKLAYAGENIIKGLFRPVFTALMTAFAVYARVKGIELPPAVETVLVGAFPAWGVDRAMDKRKKKSPDVDEDIW